MANEEKSSHEEEARKKEWLSNLANFIVEANGQTWATDGQK